MSLIQPSHPASFTSKGVLWMLVWALSFNTSMSLTKTLSGDIHSFVIVFVRLCFGFLFVSPLLLREGRSIFKTQKLPFYGLRALCTCTSMACTYYAYAHLPLTVATSIGFSEPILVSVLAFFVLGDRLTLWQWFLVFLGYGGVLLVIHPTGGIWDPAVFISLSANLFASFSIIMTKSLSKTETTAQLLFYSHVLGLILMGILSFSFWTPLCPRDIGIMALIGLSSSVSQLAIIKAMQNGDPAALTPFEYTRLLFAIPVGIFIFQEIPSLLTLCGSGLIVLSTLLMAFYNLRPQN